MREGVAVPPLFRRDRILDPLTTERTMHAEVFTARSQVIAVLPRLDDVEVLQRMDRLVHPSGVAERDIGIDPGHVFPVAWQPRQADVD